MARAATTSCPGAVAQTPSTATAGTTTSQEMGAATRWGGGSGTDVLSGGGGRDNLNGGRGSGDQVEGNNGIDTLAGGGRGDLCNGGPSADLLANPHWCEFLTSVP